MNISHPGLKRSLSVVTIGAVIMAGLYAAGVSAATPYGKTIPEASQSLPQPGSGMQTAVFAGGCFWGMEEVFEHVTGVTDVVSGYAGGDEAHANYRDSSSGQYDDAEAIRIQYDPEQVSYTQLLQIYFSVAHDPTQVDRQGPDVGTQYRSEIFAASNDQAQVARAYVQQLEQAHVYANPIATVISTGENFYPAEDYHQDYAQKHPDNMYLRINDVPKVEALKVRFADRYRDATASSSSAN
ncbi:peptide-methionine (S)-S-oxide reductase MsrA [Salinicola halimionae]|uniref:peptide-methionine (S)-S-oxide reductase MsrA n=1 Tax=Salinicola halimionae TaxID=1949081 RepID=UPI001CB6F16C|nr:peptide-methionine (S)-S-oxide reductase MsrA [Salinicola halimionae]